MRLTISHALLPVIYLVALPLNAADSIPESFQPKKESTVPTDLKTNSSYQDSWDYTQEKWGQKYPNLQIKDNKYLADRDIVLLNPAFSKQVVTLINHSYSVGNTLNSVQLNIGDGINEANGSEALNTLVKGEYVNSRGNIETGVLSVNSNGKAFNTVVDAYGSLSVSGDGEVYNSLIKTGGLQVLGTRAYAQANIIDGGVQQLSVTGNAVAEDNIVKNGGQQIIYAGTAKNSHIGDGSYQLASGLAQDTVLYSGAFQEVYSGKGETHVADSNTQVLAGAFQQITSGISENAQVYGTQTVSGVDVTWKDGSWTSDEGSKIRINGQTAKNSTIYAGGKQRIQSGTADGTQVYGVQTISGQKGGWVDGKWVDADGYTGGIRANATNTTVYAGGLQQIAWYGEADQNIIDGGTQQVDELGHISNTTIQNGGASTIAYGAYSSGDLIVKDGSLSMQAGSDHAWTENLGKGAYAANVDLQSDNAYLYIQHNDAAPESVVTIKQLTNNGVVNFGAQNGSDNGRFSRLDLNTLSGSGTFIMNTNLAGEEGDFLNISDSVSGNFHVLVRDSGYELTGSGANPYHLIYANGSSADTFAMTNGSVDLGAYKYYLVHGDASDKDNWYLSPTAVKPNPEPDPDPTPDPDPKPDPDP
ncbi:MAG: pertactin-like passenger domain-containing protein, partial [Hafnia paralvei]